MTKQFTFSSALKIRTPKDFNKVFGGQGNAGTTKKLKTAYFILLYQPNHLTNPRLGLIISKKNIPLAARRNRVKRLLRESFRLNRHKLPNLDLVFIVYPTAAKITNKVFIDELEAVLGKLL